ncbi:FxSxx-COOH system tetratricopeptide repeat protein [Streptomyces malaysiensis]|uniref:FxSxx-COOH system tetratricopeptide repeat protein n=1 Tax=Streptomyces malaysiensis subsp. samsunensis TaxID=459658 RepID=A0A9X2RXM5_STRMQ|nr:FxSxx-COOH system tetratricopeptide repeat protein [Streptomyces samsunensis]MCQ8834373.1 FxSxx-COOH system tetratricopeptide repeat protein [Streptomyces samsunensis]
MEDGPVGGELVPERGAARRIGDLKPIPEQVGPDCRALAESLRELFGAVGVSLRVLAVRLHYDAGTVSRYLNGTVVPPAEFVDQLFTHAAKATGRPSSAEVVAHVHAQQRKALRATNKVGWELQNLRDQLADADRLRQHAEVRAEALLEALLVRKQRIADMEVEQRRTAITAADPAAPSAEMAGLRQEREDLTAERDRLRAEVVRLQGALTEAKRQALEAERRCEALEHQLQTEEETAGENAESAADEAVADRLRSAQEQAMAAEERALRLASELAELRAQGTGAHLWRHDDPDGPRPVAGGTRERRATPFEERAPDGPVPVDISYVAADRSWAEWLGRTLETWGPRVALWLWEPSSPASVRDLHPDNGPHVLVVSEHFRAAGRHAGIDWDAAMRELRREGVLAALVDDVPLPFVGEVEALELRGVSEAEARSRLLTRFDGPARPGPRFPSALPAVWDGVPRRNPHLTGRAEPLAALRTRLTAAPADTAVCALLGPPGIGKTQLAAEYAHRFGPEYDVVWWARADGRTAVRERLAELAPALGLSGGGSGERVRAVHDALRRGRPYARWLIVLDGADDPDAVADLLPSGPGHVLITSRNRAWGTHYAELLDVPPLRREESVALVRRRAPGLDGDAAALLAEAVEDHPLLLDQTAGWLGESIVPVGDYVEALRAGRTEDLGLKLAAAYPLSYPVALSIQLNQLRETVPAAIDLLRLCAHFAPGPVPLDLLRAVPLRELSLPLAELLDDDLRWHATVGALAQYSVARLESGALCLPRALQQAVRASIAGDERESYARVVRLALREADPGTPDDPAAWPRYARLVPNLEPSGALDSPDPVSRKLVVGFLTYLTLSGDYATGMHIVDRATGSHPELATRRAALLRETGDYAAAEALDRSVLESLTETDAPGQRLAMARLAADLRGLARYAEAHQLACRQRDLCAASCPEDGAEARNAQRGLSRSLRMLGSYTEAAELSRQVLDSARAELGPTALVTLACETEHAYDLRLSGRHQEALALQGPSAERQREVLGAGHPLSLAAEYHLWLCDGHGDVDDIHGLLRRAADLLGEGAPTTLMIATGVTRALRREGHLTRAGEAALETVNRYRAALGERHPYTIGARANHALTLRTDFAVRLLDTALMDMAAAVGEHHPWTLGIALNTAATYHATGRHQDACALSRETGLHAAEALGERHPLTLEAHIGLAADLRMIRGGRDEADVIEEVALGGLAAVLGPDHPETVAARDRTRPVRDFEPLPV